MKAIITGTSKGIGNCIAKKLIANGIDVIGFSRTTSDINSQHFTEYLLDLTDTNLLQQKVKEILSENQIDVLINNAGCGYYGLHETIKPEALHEMITTNFEVPVLLSGLLLPIFKKNEGMIINISSVTAKNINPHGAVYGATKAALSSFSESIFAEARKYGVRVTSIHPEMTATDLYRNSNFEADLTEGCFIDPILIADTVLSVIQAEKNFNVNDITINPQFHRIKKK